MKTYARILLFLCFIVLLSNTQAHADQHSDTIRIGVILPLTGDFGFFGEQARQGITVALEEINSRKETKVEAIFEDDKCLPRDANTAFKKLTQIDKVNFILGPACSGAILAVAPLMKQSKVNVLGLLEAGEKVRNMDSKFFTLGFDSGESGKKMARHVISQGHKKIGLLFETDAWAELVKTSFTNELRKSGGEITLEVSQTPGESDYRPNILKLLQSKPDALYVVPAYNGGLFLKQLRTIDSSIPVFGPDTFAVNEVFELAGPATEGTVCSNAFVNETSKAANMLRDGISKITGKTPESLLYASMGYDGMRIAYQALTSQKPFTETMHNIQYDGVTSVNGFDNDGIAKLDIAIFQIQEQSFKQIG